MTETLIERLRGHVNKRHGPSKSPITGKFNLPNGAWAMMLDAADELTRLTAQRDELRGALEGILDHFQIPPTISHPSGNNAQLVKRARAAIKNTEAS